MRIKIDGHHVELTTAMQEYIQSKMTRIERHFEHEDMYTAVDLLFDKLDRQIKKHKEKMTNHRV